MAKRRRTTRAAAASKKRRKKSRGGAPSFNVFRDPLSPPTRRARSNSRPRRQLDVLQLNRLAREYERASEERNRLARVPPKVRKPRAPTPPKHLKFMR